MATYNVIFAFIHQNMHSTSRIFVQAPFDSAVTLDTVLKISSTIPTGCQSVTAINIERIVILTYEPPHDKTNILAYVPSEDSDQSLRCLHEESLVP